MQHNYAKAFRIIRAAFGLSQTELAGRMPVTASQLSLIEAGKRQPSVRVIEALATAVSIPPPLITLLASAPEELKGGSNAYMPELAQSLLSVLVSAQDANAPAKPTTGP